MEEKKKKKAVNAARIATGIYEIGVVFACATVGALIGDLAGSKLGNKYERDLGIVNNKPYDRVKIN